MPQFHDAPAEYLGFMRAALPQYDRLQDEVALAARELSRVERLLDLGVGTGETARRCLEAHPQAHVVGIDAGPRILEIARTALGEHADLRHARLEDPLPEGDFDLIVSALAIHHLDAGKQDLFRRVRERLRPGGRFVMGDVVVPEAPVAHPSPLEAGVDKPDRVDDMLAWLAAAGLPSRVHWADGDLAVLASDDY